MKYFEDHIDQFQKQDTRLSSLFNQISTIRIVTFVIALIVAIYAADIPNAKLLGVVVLLFLVSFVILIKWHNRVRYERNHARFMKQINDDETKRLKGDLSSFETGEEFGSDKHYYANDLDTFGRNSLYQLLNRCTTITGKAMLSKWLLAPAEKEEIVMRQEAVIELSKHPDFCQNFEAVGLHHEDEKASFEPLENWLKEEAQVLSKRWLSIAKYVLPAISTALLIGVAWFDVSYVYLLLIFIVNGVLLKTVFQYSLEITKQTGDGVSTLAGIADLVLEIEKIEVHADKLKGIKDDFTTNGAKVSNRIKRLTKILDFLNARANVLYIGFNALFLIDIHLISLTEQWKIDNRDNVKKWFSGVSEFEVLCSFARFAFANPSYVQPEILDDDYCLEVTGIGHPMIKPDERVSNDFKAQDKGRVIIITGSNMSGKSTFLRTVGVNAVLALAGAPVCATQMSISRMLVFTSMRTQDNLEEHISSFYAELKRIKELLSLVESSGVPVMFMLDEILKGTNSHDRHKGGVAIVHQLHKANAIGFVSTHDIELGQEAAKLQYCDNYSFNSEVVGNNISFDYKINDGVCQSFNASALMRNIGIEIE